MADTPAAGDNTVPFTIPVPPGTDSTTHMPLVAIPGPDVAGFLHQLDQTYAKEVADGTLSADAMKSMQEVYQAHTETVQEQSESFISGEFIPAVLETRQHMVESVGEIRAELDLMHPGVQLESMQAGDLPTEFLTRAVEPVALDGVSLERGWNSEVLGLKQQMLDTARDLIELRSQADGADPVQIAAQTAQLNGLQAELDAARDEVAARADAANSDIEKASAAARDLDTRFPHPGQTSETGPAIPGEPFASSTQPAGAYDAQVGVHDEDHTVGVHDSGDVAYAPVEAYADVSPVDDAGGFAAPADQAEVTPAGHETDGSMG